jgi:hypothetical protein
LLNRPDESLAQEVVEQHIAQEDFLAAYHRREKADEGQMGAIR